MRQVCSIKKLVRICAAAILTVNLTGCRSESVNSITKGEWIEMVTERAGMYTHAQDAPYYLNVGAQSEYFNAVQAAVEWKILDPSYPFDPGETLNREWTAFTLVNLMRDLPETSSSEVRDLNKTIFSKQVSSAAASGLMKTDKRGLFHPKDAIDREEASACLDQAVEYINNRHFDEPVMEFDWADEDTECYNEPPLSFDEASMTAQVSESSQVAENDILTWQDNSGVHAYKVASREGDSVQLEEFDLNEEADSYHIQGSTELDFNTAEFYDPWGNLMYGPGESGDASTHISLMANKENTKTYDMNGFTITTKKSNDSWTVEAEKKNEAKTGSIYASLKVNGLEADYNINYIWNLWDNTYFKIKFRTSETLGVKASYKDSRIGDFSKLDKNNFMGSMKNFMQKKNDAIQTELKLATVKIPIPHAPLVDIMVEVSLVITATGKAEIVMTQNHTVGFEAMGGDFRVIKEVDKKAEANLKATTSITGNLRAILRMFGINLTDAGIKAGAKADVKAVVHIYDDEGKMKNINASGISADLAEEASSQVDDVLVCADASGNWILDVVYNSGDTELGKKRGTTTLSFLDEKNAPLFEGAKVHFENWQRVDHCTRKDRPKSEDRETMDTNGKILTDGYAKVVRKGQSVTIGILGVPAGYTVSELTVTSSDPSVATVNGLTVTGIASGSAVIQISTPDGKYIASVNVLVPENTSA